jgi:hypothetical protein
VRWRLIDYLIKMLANGTLPPGLAAPNGLPDLSSVDGEVLLSMHPSFGDTSSTAHAQDGPALQAIHELLLQELLTEGHLALARCLGTVVVPEPLHSGREDEHS